MNNRPKEISDDDLERWEDLLKEDKLNAGENSYCYNDPVFVEVCLAGLWLAESLDQMGVPLEVIYNIQEEAGKLSYGREPWEISKFFIEAYKK